MSISRLYLHCVGVLLIGYAILDKGFAYLGVAPLFIGEMVLGIGMLCLLAGGISARVFGSPISWALLIFGAWSMARTMPYLDVYGIVAIRDSVLWLYGLYALLVAGAFLKGRTVGLGPRWYASWFPWFLVIAPIVFFIYERYWNVLPRFPGTNVPIIWMKAGDMSVHLAGVVTFMGLGLHRHFFKSVGPNANLKEFGLWMLLGFDIIAAGARNRGGFLAVIVACLVMMLFKPMNRLNRFALPALVILGLGLTFDVQIPVGGERNVSVQQMVDNIQSIVSKSDKEYLKETSSWRLEWWRRIEAETIHGEYFWLGKGYGVNLATAADYDDGTGNRSPHNAHLTILARSGVPGLVLWILVLGVVSASLVHGYFQAQAAKQDVLAKLNVWVLAYWLAYLVNASFDVYLEGPQGGIWFWCVTGFAIALNVEQRMVFARTRVKRRVAARAAARG
ncbi:MAG: O-antigen ligase domain-containing protein [Alphaproteobacteria bacterium]|nr:O-antigen ligase domain-containing protein [Alphaproteobacteria bacterium]